MSSDVLVFFPKRKVELTRFLNCNGLGAKMHLPYYVHTIGKNIYSLRFFSVQTQICVHFLFNSEILFPELPKGG